MPKQQALKKILVIGSGPIIIGQAAEFDYSGTQGCMALKEEGYDVVLVNNNPATIMTDELFANKIYFEPLSVKSITKIIEKERPDGLLANLGGQTGLNLAVKLDEKGVLDKYNVKLLGTSVDSIQKGEDREKFRSLMHELNQPVPDSEIIQTVEEAVEFSKTIGFPVIVRPAYTLGGRGGGIAEDKEKLISLVKGGISASPIGQCLIEKSIAGFKEIEYEVMRDQNGTCITVCNMENIDPVGIHTGDSIVVAPSQTLTDTEYQMLRSASLTIIKALDVVGGCNIQFALDPDSKQYYVIEVNPRVSRSSALASKATGYPIAKIAAKLAVGYSLHEVKNPLTQSTYASFEPALDYVVVKFPRWPFDKFKDADRLLGTKMKATGEVMAIDRNLESALQKAVNSLELDNEGTFLPELQNLSDEVLMKLAAKADDRRFFVLMELLRRNYSIAELHELTKIDFFFLSKFEYLIGQEKSLHEKTLNSISKEHLASLKEKGFSDQVIAKFLGCSELELREHRKQLGIKAVFKQVDTCAAEFAARTNYFYSSYFGLSDQRDSLDNKKKALVIGSGPIRIGQGVEFDYSAVQGLMALQKLGYETIMINNNPETVSTDYEIADRLYFEPLTVEHILNVIEEEEIDVTLVQFGGQTAINLVDDLEKAGVKLLGTDSYTLDVLEDREKFYKLLDSLELPHAAGYTAFSKDEAVSQAEKIGFPILLRPSYVIGGKGMHIVESNDQLITLLQAADSNQYPLLIDKYITGKEIELDLIADGHDVFIPTVIEHIERAGVHSGDSFAMLPSQSISKETTEKLHIFSEKIVRALQFKGIMNIQFLIEDSSIYILEVNPRASRTVPVVSKVMEIPMVGHATKLLTGEQLAALNLPVHMEDPSYVAVKFPVFSSHALQDVDPKVGPEMKSTGEGLCIGLSVDEALAKVFEATIEKEGTVFIDQIDAQLEAELSLAGITAVSEEFEQWLYQSEALIYLSNQQTDKKQKQRLLATERGIPVFTEKETLLAFLKGVQNDGKHDVLAIQDHRNANMSYSS
ncbi:carbamoyl phosphate synthase large subunit [Metabacillus arenae]|uniref:Carbamoyl phosphate synthase large chain n=1 Tax=Metabacillus arenae TaxID=2771434 RepID=A0A926NT49_9BACI|nr:carbamoyl phosphate synthase large subunit [Metabacillus arenae]MBD1383451.1 carbamoyl phosphate synthase large subunit [Metabacillus arenae]